jgi:hypothetical protein
MIELVGFLVKKEHDEHAKPAKAASKKTSHCASIRCGRCAREPRRPHAARGACRCRTRWLASRHDRACRPQRP